MRYPSQQKTGHFKVYEIRHKESNKLLYIGVTSYTLSRRCSGNSQYNYKIMYVQEVGQFDTRDEAEEIESILIKRYRPPFNQATGPRSTGIKQSREWVNKRVNNRRPYTHSADVRQKIGKANGHRVKCVETDQIFYSLAEAARWCDGQDSKISLVVRGKRKTHKGYHWELV